MGRNTPKVSKAVGFPFPPFLPRLQVVGSCIRAMFPGSGRRGICWWFIDCLLLKCIHFFWYSRKIYDVPRRITIFFLGRFYSRPVFQSSFSSSFTSSPGGNSCDRYMTCDAVDGKHARNTKQSTPLGAVVPWALHLGGSFFFVFVGCLFGW